MEDRPMRRLLVTLVLTAGMIGVQVDRGQAQIKPGDIKDYDGAMQALKSKSGPDRAAGLSFLAILGSEAKTASREIVTSLFDTDAEARKWAGMALKEANPTISGPVLTLVQGKTYGD